MVTNNLGISTADDLAEMVNDLGASLTFSGQTITGLMSSEERVREVDELEDIEVYMARFDATKADFSTLPSVATGETVTVEGTKYYVAGITEDEFAETVLIDLKRVQ
jgi:hypothetical protein